MRRLTAALVLRTTAATQQLQLRCRCSDPVKVIWIRWIIVINFIGSNHVTSNYIDSNIVDSNNDIDNDSISININVIDINNGNIIIVTGNSTNSAVTGSSDPVTGAGDPCYLVAVGAVGVVTSVMTQNNTICSSEMWL